MNRTSCPVHTASGRDGRLTRRCARCRTCCGPSVFDWVLDIDIRKYFDSIPHSHLRAFLDQRVTDGVIRRMIDKWLKAGAVEDGLLSRTTEGLPARGCDLALPLERLPAPCVGRMVRDRGETASERGVRPCPVCRRRADGVRQH